MRDIWAWAAVCGLLFLGGCGGGDDASLPSRAPAEVKILYKGSPLDGAHVSLNPVDATGKAAFGTTDAEGVAKLSTFGGDDGAVPGQYQVTVRKTKTEGGAPPVDPNNPMAMPSNAESLPPPKTIDLVPPKYGSAETSGLQATVSESGENRFEFTLE